MDVGSCKQPQRRFVSRNECCGGNGAAPSNLGFTESDMNDQEWFMAAAIGEGTSCSSCLGNYYFITPFIVNKSKDHGRNKDLLNSL